MLPLSDSSCLQRRRSVWEGSDIGSLSGVSASSLRLSFLKWQCRVRQEAMRNNAGCPDAGMIPALFLPGEDAPLGDIIVVLNKSRDCSVVPELNYMLSCTNDPAQRREQGLRFFSASYFQRASEFSDILTATFLQGSACAAKILEARRVRLVFDAFSQRFELDCHARRLLPEDLLCQATLAHNSFFNPALSPETEVFGFEPDWSLSKSGDC